MKRVSVGVRKQDICALAKWSTRLRYMAVLVYWSSSTKSRDECTMNGLWARASEVKRGMPSPLALEVPNSREKRGVSCGDMMEK